MGLGYSLATTTLIVSVIKWIYGGLRPHFLAVCKPKTLPTIFPSYYTAAEVCTGSRWAMREVQMSFPSGHAAAAFAGFGYLALYLNAKYKTFGPNTNGDGRRVHHWKLVMFVLPWLFAVVVAASKVLDGWHHPADVIAGAIIGTILAHLAFKMVFRSVYDSRDNHVPRE
jgi:diacylglycerol diphosphate phosphatase/phosphatidate phosphatase